MTKREVVHAAWRVATGRSYWTHAHIYRIGRGYEIATGSQFESLPKPRSASGMPEYKPIQHDSQWDCDGRDATQAEIADYLFGDESPL
jgi:hypothetical protein